MTTKKEQKAAEVLANRRAAFEKKVRGLLGHVFGRVNAAELDAAFAKVAGTEYGPAADALAAEIASREPVGRAIHPLKAEAAAHAEQMARETVARVERELAAAGWDREVYAPYPHRISSWSADFVSARAKYNLVHCLTESADGRGSRRIGEADPARMSDEGVERFVSQAGEMAALDYDAFICKMVGKVGECDDATIEGSHVWGSSILTVRKGATTERWHTQQIVNQTKYGRLYYQWPSRLKIAGRGRP